jgi:hypothetical protein
MIAANKAPGIDALKPPFPKFFPVALNIIGVKILDYNADDYSGCIGRYGGMPLTKNKKRKI